jgi:hypothetical protein
VNRLITGWSAIVIVVSACGTTAQERSAPPSQDPKIKAAPAPKPESAQPRLMRTSCYTNVSDCAGLAYFQNTDSSRTMACNIWANNGANGVTDFTVGPRQTHSVHVRYNDTANCAWGTTPPDSFAQRYYIWVQ